MTEAVQANQDGPECSFHTWRMRRPQNAAFWGQMSRKSVIRVDNTHDMTVAT